MKSQTDIEFKGLRDKLSEFRVDPPNELWGNISRGIEGNGRRRTMIILLATAASIALAVSLGIAFVDLDKNKISPVVAEAPAVHDDQFADSPAVSKGEASRREQIVQRDAGAAEAKRNQEEVPREMIRQGRLEQRVVDALSEIEQDEVIVAENLYEEEVAVQVDREVLSGDEREVTAENRDTSEEQEQVPGISPDPVPVDVPLLQDDFLEEETRSGEKRWIISGVVSPLYSFRDAGGSMASNSAVNNVESAMIAYAGGVNVGFQPGARFTIESGILYNKMGINIGEISGASGQWRAFDFGSVSNEVMSANVMPVANSIGNIVSNSGDIFINSYKESGVYALDVIDSQTDFKQVVTMDGVKQNLEYLEIPLNLRYSVIDRSIELQLIGGVSTNFLVNNSVTAQTADGTEEIGYVSNLNSVNYSGNAGIGMIYHFHSNFSISIEPRFRYYMNSINDNTLPATRPYTMGFYTGINYRF